MLGDVVKRAGEGAGSAIAGPTEGLAETALGLLLSPWGLVVLVVAALVVRAVR